MYLNERVGDKWRKWGFDALYSDVISTLELEKGLTVTGAACKSILEGERNKMRRRDEWKAKQKK